MIDQHEGAPLGGGTAPPGERPDVRDSLDMRINLCFSNIQAGPPLSGGSTAPGEEDET
jgi:hypothetical protein